MKNDKCGGALAEGVDLEWAMTVVVIFLRRWLLLRQECFH